ncbi:hypothetical protein [Stenoxybacter acetivorans]|nr:hypothetical protein [Stenoxybacter acetivorans]
MKSLILLIITSALLTACTSAPKPHGTPFPINTEAVSKDSQ